MTRFILLGSVAAGIVLAVACGSSNDAPELAPNDASVDSSDDNDSDAGDEGPAPDAAPDADFGAASDAYPAFKPPVPQIVTNNGPVMTTVRIVPVFFQGDTLQTQLLDFLSKYQATMDWKTAVHEYGVGDLTIAAPVVVPTVPGATITDTEMQTLVQTSLDGTHADWGPIDTQTLATSIYVLFFPNGTSVINDHRNPPVTACSPGQFYAYHSAVKRGAAMRDGGVDAASDGGSDGGSDSGIEGGVDGGVGVDDPIIYAAMARCPAIGGQTQLDLLTSLVVHETTEAATDPLVATGPYGYSWLDIDHQVWAITSIGGEVGDMCQNFTYSFPRPTDVGYRIQRTWSNASIAAYHDPCVPVPAGQGPFFASVPIEPDAIFIPNNSQQLRVKGVKVSVGQQKTIDVELLSDGPRSAWAIFAFDYSKDFQGEAAANLQLTLDKNTGVNGEKVHLTIKPLKQPASKSAFYALESRGSGQSIFWWGAVSIP